jgi:quinoprotein relay system zinc metallohydrolase 2
VCVIDPGGALADGEALRAALRRVTDRPISHVVMTHVHPDHVFGAGAFTRDRPVFVGHAGLPALLSQRGGFYRDRLNEVLGAGAAGPVVLPSMLVSDRGRIDLGGRVLRLTAHRPAHTGADLSVLDEATSTLITGDLVFVRRAPSLDGDLKGWLAVLADLRGAPARRAVPGHGPVSCDWPAAAADIERYLTTLLTETRAAIAAGTPMQAAAQSVARGERGRWLLFDDYNPRNVLEAYQALQWE